MTDFTKNELIVLQVALDTMVRTEGNSLAQAGIVGLQQGRAGILADRLSNAVTSLAKVNDALVAMDVTDDADPKKAN